MGATRTKRAADASPASLSPLAAPALKRRSLDAACLPGWLAEAVGNGPDAAAVAAVWPCLAALNAAMAAHAHAYGAIVVRSRTTITRRAAADLAPRLAPPPPPAPRPAHSVLAAALLTSAFATGGDGGPVCPDAAASLFEIETPPFLASFAAAWAGGAPTLRLLCLHGYLRGQPPCGPGHGLGEERAAWGGVGGAPARTAFVLVPP